MKRFQRIAVACALVLVACGVAFAGGTTADVASKGELVVAIGNFDSEPFYVGPAHMAKGYDVDLAQAIADKLGVKLKIVRPEWTGGIDKAWTDGYAWDEFDIAVSTITMREDRMAKCDFSEPYFVTGQRIVASSESPFANIEDAKKGAKKIAVMSGSVAEAVASKEFAGGKIIAVKDIQEIENAIDLDIAEVGIYDGIVLEMLVNRNSHIKVLDGLLTNETYGVATKKGSDMKAIVDSVIAEKKAELDAKWFPKK